MGSVLARREFSRPRGDRDGCLVGPFNVVEKGRFRISDKVLIESKVFPEMFSWAG